MPASSYHSVLEAVESGVLVFATSGVLDASNRAARRLLGVQGPSMDDAAGVLDRGLDPVSPHQTPTSIRALVDQVIADDTPVTVTVAADRTRPPSTGDTSPTGSALKVSVRPGGDCIVVTLQHMPDAIPPSAAPSTETSAEASLKESTVTSPRVARPATRDAARTDEAPRTAEGSASAEPAQEVVSVLTQTRLEELRAREAQYRRIVEQPEILVHRYAPDTTETFANEAYAAFLGKDPDDVVGSRWLDDVAEPDRSGLVALLDRIERDGVQTYEHWIPDATGTSRYIQWHNRGFFDDDGSLTEIQSIGVDLTERRRAEIVLEESQERFRQVTESIREVFWLRTAEHLLYVSPSYESVWDQPVERLYADPNAYRERIHPDDLDRVDSACRALIHDNRTMQIEYRLVHEDGEVRWVEVKFTPVADATEEARFAGVVRDVTAQKQAEQRLRQSEKTYRNLIDHASDAIYVQDREGRFLDVSRGAARMYGLKREALIGSTPQRVSAPGRNDFDALQDALDAAFAGQPQRFEFWGQRVDGSVFPKEVRLERASYFGMEVVVAFALDISERHAAEEALRESERRFRLVAENARDVIMLHDAVGNTLWASPSVAEVFGRTPEQVCALSAFDVIHPDDAEAVHAHHTALLAGTNRGPITYRVRHADGHYIWMESLVQAIYDGDVLTRIQSSSRDVTEQVARNRELKRAKQDAEEADHLKSALLANMSHEIRTPLTAIIGFAEVLKEELGSTHHQRFATLIHDSSRRLMQTLDSVLQLSKLEAGIVTLESEPIDLGAEVLDTVELLRPHAERRGVDLRMTTDPSLPRGEWDDGAVHRIVQNLVGNAIKFTEEGGTVTVSVRHRGDHAQIEVSDTGIGIDEDFLPDIFEPFRQESAGMGRSHEGSGLGLAIVRRLVEIMGGTTSVDSTKGVGTTFTIRLPLTRS